MGAGVGGRKSTGRDLPPTRLKANAEEGRGGFYGLSSTPKCAPGGVSESPPRDTPFGPLPCPAPGAPGCGLYLRFPLRCTGPREVDLGERERGVTFSSSLPPLLVCALLPRPDPPHRKKALLLAVRRLQRPGRRACCPAGRPPSPRLGPRAWVLRAPTGSTGRTGRDRKPEPRREGRPDSLRRGAGLPGHAGPRPLEATPPRRPCTCLLPGRCTSLLFFEKPVCRQ